MTVVVGVRQSPDSRAAIRLAAQEALYRDTTLIAVMAYPAERGWSPAVKPGATSLTAADDRGTGYQMSCHGSSSRPGEWTLRLHPDPPRDLGWLDLTTTPGKPPVRIDLTPPRPAAAAVRPVTGSPAGQLLTNLATRLLTTGAIFPQDILILLTELELAPERPWPPDTADGLGNVIAALQASGALPPASPVPGQLAALCARLNVTGHGITVPPARDLPEPWLSVLTHHRAATRTAPERDGCAAAGPRFPTSTGSGCRSSA